MEFESTGLWTRGLGEQDGHQHTAARERLRAVYRRFWENACHLAGQIGRDLPSLTLHDVHHFEALWDRADQIAGPSLRLTPLETFVFGGAVLLHDAANTAAAFPAGMDEIRQTPEWRDALYSMGADAAAPSSTLDANVARDALLITLRSLHAQRAEALGGLSVTNLNTGTTHHLIDDDVIRTHLGSVIGKVAASHHWDVEELERRLPSQIGALSGFPREWIIRPILVACLLRCADAVQIDQSRVPDFLMALLKLRGVSESHWRAQSFLTAPLVDSSDSKSLVFASSRPYREEDADAWWIAYDAIRVAHAELQACSVLLNDLRLPTFAIDRVRNAESPSRLSETVQTAGWRPVSAEVRASRVARIIEIFGGDQLYGNEPQVALRELIQNAIDAIRHRRILEPAQATYGGSVTIGLLDDEPSGGVWLVVEDDGLGMSEAVLTGPLIDFGESYIASRLAQDERPGLSAASKRRIGRFGVGFFSVFMLGQEVRVSSRPFDGSLDDVRTLIFRSGLILRPLLLDRPVHDFGGQTSTRVSVLLSREKFDQVLSPRWGQQGLHLKVRLDQLVQALCPFSDVDIFVQAQGQPRRLVRARGWPPADIYIWLREVTLADARAEPALDSSLAAVVENLRPIDPSDPMAGVAAVSFSGGPAGVRTIGGLRAGTLWGGYSESYVGVFDHEPDGPDRSRGQLRADSLLADWATNQAHLLAAADLQPEEKARAALNVFNLQGDPLPIAVAYLYIVPTLLVHFVYVLGSGERLLIIYQWERFGAGDAEDRPAITTLRINQHNPWMSYFRPEEIRLTERLIEPFDSSGPSAREFWVLPKDNPLDPEPKTFFGCLLRECSRRGLALSLESQEISIGKYIGLGSERDGLVTDSEIVRRVSVLSV